MGGERGGGPPFQQNSESAPQGTAMPPFCPCCPLRAASPAFPWPWFRPGSLALSAVGLNPALPHRHLYFTEEEGKEVQERQLAALNDPEEEVTGTGIEMCRHHRSRRQAGPGEARKVREVLIFVIHK